MLFEVRWCAALVRCIVKVCVSRVYEGHPGIRSGQIDDVGILWFPLWFCGLGWWVALVGDPLPMEGHFPLRCVLPIRTRRVAVPCPCVHSVGWCGICGGHRWYVEGRG